MEFRIYWQYYLEKGKTYGKVSRVEHKTEYGGETRVKKKKKQRKKRYEDH